MFNQKQIFLTAHGLDTIGNVTLNGHLLGPVENMFVRYKWNVKKLLKGKANVLEISFESAPLYGKRMYDKSVKQKYPIPPCKDESACLHRAITTLMYIYSLSTGCSTWRVSRQLSP